MKQTCQNEKNSCAQLQRCANTPGNVRPIPLLKALVHMHEKALIEALLHSFLTNHELACQDTS